MLLVGVKIRDDLVLSQIFLGWLWIFDQQFVTIPEFIMVKYVCVCQRGWIIIFYSFL
jgi:hypothetical protein